MNYRGQWVINKKQLPILLQCEDKELGIVLKALFKHIVQQESVDSVLKGATSSVKLAFRLLTESNGDGVSPTGDRVSPSSLSPSEKETKEKNQKKGEEKIHSPSRSISIIPQLFERFWEAYPRKVGKAAAEKSFAKCVGKDRETQQAILDQMLKTLEWQKRTDQWQEAEFIPHPATWLNQHRWKDEPVLSTEEAAEIKAGEACKNINREMDELTRNLVAELGGGENENRS